MAEKRVRNSPASLRESKPISNGIPLPEKEQVGCLKNG